MFNFIFMLESELQECWNEGIYTLNPNIKIIYFFYYFLVPKGILSQVLQVFVKKKKITKYIFNCGIC